VSGRAQGHAGGTRFRLGRHIESSDRGVTVAGLPGHLPTGVERTMVGALVYPSVPGREPLWDSCIRVVIQRDLSIGCADLP
jgi:hypothetical protein